MFLRPHLLLWFTFDIIHVAVTYPKEGLFRMNFQKLIHFANKQNCANVQKLKFKTWCSPIKLNITGDYSKM